MRNLKLIFIENLSFQNTLFEVIFALPGPGNNNFSAENSPCSGEQMHNLLFLRCKCDNVKIDWWHHKVNGVLVLVYPHEEGVGAFCAELQN